MDYYQIYYSTLQALKAGQTPSMPADNTNNAQEAFRQAWADFVFTPTLLA
jgi:hypothetical protein